ncbi:MAG: hypothetical protein OXI80_12195 [Caldilineaceae bacterium]|nr:hypothetical protein [Caldilineaceae bacterium]
MWIRVAAAEILGDGAEQFYGSGAVALPPHVTRHDVAAEFQAALDRLRAVGSADTPPDR